MKYSPHALYFKRHKKSKESPYCTSNSNESSQGSHSQNPRYPSFNNDYNLGSNNGSGNSRFGSDGSGLSNGVGNPINLRNRKITNSEEKQLEPEVKKEPEKVEETLDSEKSPEKQVKDEKTEKPASNVQIIEDYGITFESNKRDEDKKASIVKPPQKLQDSLVTASSPSRGSVLTNPQQPGGRFGSSLNNSNTQDIYPLKPGKAIQLFKGILTDYEKGEILNYREIYFVGEHAKKVRNFNSN